MSTELDFEKKEGGRPVGRWPLWGLVVQGSRSYRDRSGEPVKLKKTTTTQTAIQMTVIMGVL